MDDQVAVDPASTSASAIVCMRRVAAALGFRLKHSKEKFPAHRHVALGAVCSLPSQGAKCTTVALPDEKKDTYHVRLMSILNTGLCPPAMASKVGGYIQTIASRQWGRCARSYVWPVYHQANHGLTDELSPQLRWSIFVLLRLLSEARPRIIRPLLQRKLLIMYWDSCGKPECLAGLLLSHNDGGKFFSTSCAPSVQRFLDPELEENRNTQLETLAPVLCLSTFSSQLEGCDILAYGDNQTALGALRKGYSPSLFMCSIVAEFWCMAQALDIHVWLEYVASKDNPADPLSRPFERPGLDYARVHSWQRLEACTPEPKSFRFPI